MPYQLARCWLLSLALLLTVEARADDADLFAMAESGVFIIQVTDRQTEAQGAIGSGFLVGPGLVATNYHVISEQLLHPETHALRMETHEQDRIPARVVAVDVVHDLALVAPEDSAELLEGRHRFELTEAVPAQGTRLSAIGNPYDVGMSIVPGTYNGPVRRSYQGRLHFTGALNPGMSGGPTVDADGRVVGINVAGAGNSVSFLVPARRLQDLLDRHDPQTRPDYDSLAGHMREDLARYGEGLLDDLLAGDWSLETFGPIQAPREIADYVHCAGSGKDPGDERKLEPHALNCGVYDRIFLSPMLDTGTLEMDYYSYETEELSPIRLYEVVDGQNFSPFNQAHRDDVTAFDCRNDIVSLDALDGATFKTVFCVRGYLDYEGFYDVLLTAHSLAFEDEIITLHYTLAGVTREVAKRFNEAFLGAVRWN